MTLFQTIVNRKGLGGGGGARGYLKDHVFKFLGRGTGSKVNVVD